MEKWKKFFRRNYPTLIFSAKELKRLSKEDLLKHPFYLELIDTLHKITTDEYRKIAISLLGYPNVGKQTIVEIFKNLNFKAFKSSVNGLYEVIFKNFKYFISLLWKMLQSTKRKI